jgi:lipid II:glycine glycyltransferase (peptidoglycan interpeptide bridge formation enzyme)
MNRNDTTRGEKLEHISLSVTPTRWDAWLAANPASHPLQLSGWGALKARFGWKTQRIALLNDKGEIAAGAQILLRSAYGVKMAYAPRGPLVDWGDDEQRQTLFELIELECRRLGVGVLKIEPALPDTPASRALLHASGFRPSAQTIQPPSTILIDLAGDDAMLAAMKPKWRYNVRLAERKGVTVRVMQRSDLPAFHQLMRATGARDGFAVHSDAYFDAAFDLLTPDHAAFLVAECAGEALAAIVVALAGKTAVYLWGASSERERSRMPNHALQWAGMRWARDRGAACYDLWGIPDDLGQLAMTLAGGAGDGVASEALPIQLEALPGHGLWGVYRFKQGFGGRVVRMVDAWDKPIQQPGAQLYFTGLAAMRWKNSLTAKLRAVHFPAQPAGDDSGARATSPKPATMAIDDPEQWRAVLAQTPAPHVLQSWEWGEIKAQTEWRAERLALETSAGKAAFQFLWRQPVCGAPLRIGYVPKGPALDWTNLDLVDETLAAVERHARRRDCIFVKIDPDVREDTTAGRLALHALERRGWRFSAEQIQFKNTATTDLRLGEDVLLANMKNKWRYNVRLAEKRGVVVRIGNEYDLLTFYSLYEETGRRDGFLIRPLAYYLTTWKTFLTAQRMSGNPAGGALLLAEHPDDPQPLAGLFLLRYGATTWYFYGASSERHRRDMPNHLLQWEALRWAAAQGCTTYDWWGAPTQLDDPNDPMQGVWRFKQGFGAEFQPHIGAWDYVISPIGYRIITESLPLLLAAMRLRKTS